jgi:hypothetical protein
VNIASPSISRGAAFSPVFDHPNVELTYIYSEYEPSPPIESVVADVCNLAVEKSVVAP